MYKVAEEHTINMKEMNEMVKKMMSEATTEKLKDMERSFVIDYARHNGVSNFNPDKNFTALIAIEEQLNMIRAELKSRV